MLDFHYVGITDCCGDKLNKWLSGTVEVTMKGHQVGETDAGSRLSRPAEVRLIRSNIQKTVFSERTTPCPEKKRPCYFRL